MPRSGVSSPLGSASSRSTYRGRNSPLARAGSLSSPVVCRHDDPDVPWPDRLATLASLVMEPGVPRLRVADGLPCERPLVEVALP